MQILFTNLLVSCLGVALYGQFGENVYAQPYYESVCPPGCTCYRCDPRCAGCNCDDPLQCSPGCNCCYCDPVTGVCTCLDPSMCNCRWNAPGLPPYGRSRRTYGSAYVY
ncbi:hypothetical protein CRM22_001278 [Opisthorchis felineus]|uniref:Antistasin-like domain-containing protein n=1 Tax=Opisthorchis felineus TaxID=147828 RepID=A0A4S2MBC4_OPIFE|nr:hypothetical protein CRM22_001278 [Opisthorchis felineus]